MALHTPLRHLAFFPIVHALLCRAQAVAELLFGGEDTNILAPGKPCMLCSATVKHTTLPSLR